MTAPRSPERSASQPTEAESVAKAPVSLPEGTLLRDEYRIEDVLGTGSFGITYRARDEHLDTIVAVKEYYPRQMAGRTGESVTVHPYSSEATEDFAYGLEQFMQEGRRIARFDHPNVVDVRSYFEENGTGYLVMDYYEGKTLAEYLAQNGGTLPEEEALALGQDVLSGLRPVHDTGVLHRDIDPRNVYRTTDGEAVLLDFGAARETMGQKSQDLSVILKPGYAPIEQYSTDGDQGPHTDIYACAATLYECLTGLKPPEATERVQNDELVPPRDVRAEISMETSVAVRKGLAVYPDQRPASAEAFSSLLRSTRTASRSTEAATETLDEAVPSAVKEAPHESATEVAGSSSFAEDVESADSSAGLTAWDTIGGGVGLAGLVGGTLWVSDAGAMDVLAFFGTWLAVCFGVIGLFREGEKLMSFEARAAVSDWLLEEDFAERTAHWPETFVALFDAVFTRNHLSWTCFLRSAVVSVATVALGVTGMIGFGLMGWMTVRGASNPFLGVILAFLPMGISNIFIDYVSLFETRWVLGQIRNEKRLVVQMGYLVLDLLLTAVVFWGTFFIIATVGGILSGGLPLGTFSQLGGWVDWVLDFSGFLYSGFLSSPSPRTAMMISTFFTSIWVWLYVLAGGLIRALYPLLGSLEWLKQRLDVDRRPVHALGLLLAVFTTMAFAFSAPFVL